MRFLFLAAAVLLSQASAAAPGGSDAGIAAPVVVKPGSSETGECRKASSYRADTDLAWRDEPPAPRKLTELPGGHAYMAVYRTVNGCEVPMSVVEYRNSGRR